MEGERNRVPGLGLYMGVQWIGPPLTTCPNCMHRTLSLIKDAEYKVIVVYDLLRGKSSTSNREAWGNILRIDDNELCH